MSTPVEKRNETLGKALVAKLETRHFEAYYCPTAKEAIEKALSLVPEKSSVSWGGSMSIRDMGLTKAFHDGNFEVIDRDLAKSPEEMGDLHRQALLTDYFITSTNAISKDGILVNIDGTGNRVAALCFGPKNVIVICGINKVAPDLDCAVARARNVAAPINAFRFMGKTPCVSTGSCHNCTSPDCICSQVVITRTSRPEKRIKVILVGEELGY
ncbi:lactate utilization protein [Anaerotignum sp. MB30-C6]|uniref:lactate utilization protein n=1 Tax=Anaerotignum sp. MB30-C6 TaxID=3070814 RepID=UPI0027DC5B66|nr:lactate utilization protein [Anaerotignum sp. MB30-C6]WMI81994.1 lactate utilization protein [Anaerotignum sp. MB30-C6]